MVSVRAVELQKPHGHRQAHSRLQILLLALCFAGCSYLVPGGNASDHAADNKMFRDIFEAVVMWCGMVMLGIVGLIALVIYLLKESVE